MNLQIPSFITPLSNQTTDKSGANDFKRWTDLHIFNSQMSKPPVLNNVSTFNPRIYKDNQLYLQDIYVCDGGNELSAGTAQTLCMNKNKLNNMVLDMGGEGGDPSKKWSQIQEIYIGSITVVGLFILFRILQKSF